MRNQTFAAACLLALSLAGAAIAGPKFAAYDGHDAIREGEGGTKVVTDGVEFWTSGTPPHRYQVLGMLTDNRGTGLFSGDAVGSHGIASRVKEVGGNAVLLAGEGTQIRGAMIISGNIALARRRTTEFVVVKYLDGSSGSEPSPSIDHPH